MQQAAAREAGAVDARPAAVLMTHDPVVFRFSAENILDAPHTCSLVTVPELVQAVEQWCRRQQGRSEPAPALVIDLSAVMVWDMAVFRTLVWAKRRCLRVPAEVHLVLRSGAVFEPHEEAIVRELFNVRDAAPAEASPTAG